MNQSWFGAAGTAVRAYLSSLRERLRHRSLRCDSRMESRGYRDHHSYVVNEPSQHLEKARVIRAGLKTTRRLENTSEPR
jgi:hypothetical protein